MKISIIGAGYVGLPLAVAFSKYYDVVVYEISVKRVNQLNNNYDHNNEVSKNELLKKNFLITNKKKFIKNSNFYIITVPTPINDKQEPDLSLLLSATQLVASSMSGGSIIIYESTTYPGCTEEYCLPIIKNISGLSLNIDFGLSFSPERINPGDRIHTLRNIKKIVSGSNKSTLEKVSKLYNKIIKVGTIKASSIKVAEAAKVIENSQRDLNIAFVNELSIIFNKLNINTKEVIDAAATKWNFHSYNPGLVGGHCISVDPYYLSYKSKIEGYKPRILLAGRNVNESIPNYIAKNLFQKLKKHKINLNKAKVAVLGFSFKENCPDIRNTKVYDLVCAINKKISSVLVVDPVVHAREVKKYYKINLTKIENIKNVDVLILAVSHKNFQKIDLKSYKKMFGDKKIRIFYDLKSNFNLEKLKSNGFDAFQL
jgi:UDP-N-acetyl-D-galactosamine dehydrogenase